MTRQTPAPLEAYSLTTTARSAREITRMVAEGMMTVNPPYQRTSVWTIDQRISLVESWCRGVPIPAIVVNDRRAVTRRGRWQGDDTYVWAVVDGRQRAETAIMWFGGTLAVPASWFPAEDVERTEQTADGPYVRYTGLSRALQRGQGVGLFQLPMSEGSLLSEREEAHLYLLLNSAGTAQTAADLDQARRIAEAAP